MYSGMPKGHCILGVLWLSYVLLLECRTDCPCEKSIPLCYRFDTLIHSLYGELTIHRQKNAFCKHVCLKQSSFKTQLGFNIHYTYMKLKVKEKQSQIYVDKICCCWLSAFTHLWSWIIAELFMDCSSAFPLLISHFGKVSKTYLVLTERQTGSVLNILPVDNFFNCIDLITIHVKNLDSQVLLYFSHPPAFKN